MLVAAQPALATQPGPANVRVGDQPCATDATGSFHNPPYQLTYTAEVGAATEATWALWPVSDPAQRREEPAGIDGGIAHGQIDNYKLTANTPYQLAVRTPESDWTTPCTVTLDTIRPTATATSAVYLGGDQWEPRGGLGVPGEFTFTAGSADVVGYRYRFYRGSGTYPEMTYVAADGLGGPATITWAPPETGGWWLMLEPVDRAGNTSELIRPFTVRDIRPWVFSSVYNEFANNPVGNIGVPGVFAFSPGMPNVTQYTYRLDDAPEQTVTAGADNKAEVTLAPTHGGINVLYVRNTDQDGASSTDREYRFLVDTAPVITRGESAIGSPTTIKLTSRFAGTTAYEYWLREWDGTLTAKTRIAAAADETAQFVWTPPHNRFNTVYVQGFRADGATSETRGTNIYVNDVAPSITVSGAAETGVPGTIRFTSPMQHITHYTYWSDRASGPRGTVPAGPDGTATAAWTPQLGGTEIIRAEAHNAGGYVSGQGAVSHRVLDKPRVSSAEFPHNGSGPLATGTFTLSPRQLGVTEYRYTIDGKPYVTVPAGPDGTASFTWTPPRVNGYQLRVHSRDAAGRRSEDTFHNFTVVE
jgi:hypothetical protein